jgi:ubiquinone/menaquinone biosynthesis C-methylase UbiE
MKDYHCDFDISRNALDNLPFNNTEAVNQINVSAIYKFLPSSVDLHDLKEDPYPIPSLADREGYNVGADGTQNYLALGYSDYYKVMQAAKTYGISINKYFELGAASGRATRHFVTQRDTEEVWCSDINNRHVRWLLEHIPTVKPIFHPALPTLPLESNYFDIVTAFSVFTHIDTFETAWLAELRRILKPGGMAYITIHDDFTWKDLKDLPDTNRVITTLRSVDSNINVKLLEDLPYGIQSFRHTQTGPYRALTYHSQSYIHKVWGRYFKIKDIIPMHHGKQAVVLLIK